MNVSARYICQRSKLKGWHSLWRQARDRSSKQVEDEPKVIYWGTRLEHSSTRKESEVSTDRIKEIEQKIAELKARLPAHSAPVSMLLELEELEDDLEAVKKGENHEK